MLALCKSHVSYVLIFCLLLYGGNNMATKHCKAEKISIIQILQRQRQMDY